MGKAEKEKARASVPEAEQPYQIPDNWQWVKLSDMISKSKETTSLFSPNIKYVGLEHMDTGRGVVSYGSAEAVKSLKNVFHDGQILYGKLRPYLNKHDVARFSGVCSTDILVFDAKKCCSAEYLNYYLDFQTFLEYVISNSRGINLPRVTESIILNAVCPLPPLAEQERIVARIESLFSKLDEAKEKVKSVSGYSDTRDTTIGIIDTMKRSILARAFRGELGTNRPEEERASLD